ncbi:hypothetical protein C8R44DRAFT_741228 [Mycena epipterygia]|nr:hypothetical protein C8R44DRAFT_741228 [Mycena epipterygia]
MSDTPRLPGKSPQQPVPFAVQRRRSKLACVNCKKRKVRVCNSTVATRFADEYGLSHLTQCIAPEQPPTNPCARCTRRRLTCEYVVSTEDDSSPPANQSPETDLPDVSIDPPPDMIWTPPMTAANLSRNMAPPLPCTGPPPLNRHPRYSGQPLPDLGQLTRYSNQVPMHLRYLSPPPAVLFQSSTHPRFGEQTTYHSRPSVPPAPMYGYDVQARQHLSTRVRPPSMPPNMAGQHYPSAPNAADYEMSFGDTSMDEYFEWPPDSSSRTCAVFCSEFSEGYENKTTKVEPYVRKIPDVTCGNMFSKFKHRRPEISVDKTQSRELRRTHTVAISPEECKIQNRKGDTEAARLREFTAFRAPVGTVCLLGFTSVYVGRRRPPYPGNWALCCCCHILTWPILLLLVAMFPRSQYLIIGQQPGHTVSIPACCTGDCRPAACDADNGHGDQWSAFGPSHSPFAMAISAAAIIAYVTHINKSALLGSAIKLQVFKWPSRRLVVKCLFYTHNDTKTTQLIQSSWLMDDSLSLCNPKKRHYPRYWGPQSYSEIWHSSITHTEGAWSRREPVIGLTTLSSFQKRYRIWRFALPLARLCKPGQLTGNEFNDMRVWLVERSKAAVHSDGDKSALSLSDLEILWLTHFTWSVVEHVLPSFLSEDSDETMVAAEERSDSSSDSIDWDVGSSA